MKISERTNPVLSLIGQKSLSELNVYSVDVIGHELLNKMDIDFKNHVNYFDCNISYITQPFGDAIRKSFNSLIRDDVWCNIGEVNGCILNLKCNLGLSFLDDVSVCYYIKGEAGEKEHTNCLFFIRNHNGAACFEGYRFQRNGTFEANYSNYLTACFKSHEVFQKYGDGSDLLNEIDDVLYSIVIAHINFIKYAEVETKILPPKSTTKDIACKYVNETKSKIKILNSTWFTNLVKSDAFSVRGHFRLQPCGHENKDKKLIWINEFQKEGYTAKARMLTA